MPVNTVDQGANRNQNRMPEQGYEQNHVRDWCLEAIRWSREAHERDWCYDNYIFYKHYKNYVETRIDPDSYHTNIGAGLAYPAVKAISALLMAPWQSGDTIIDVNALEDIGTRRAPLVGAYINDVLINRTPRAFSKLELVKESSIAFGRGIVKHLIRTQPPQQRLMRVVKRMFQNMVAGGVPMPQLSWEMVPRERRYQLDYVDPFNFWWIGADRWFDNATLSVERSYMTHHELLIQQAAGEIPPELNIQPGEALGYDEFAMKRAYLDGGPGDTVHARRWQNPPHRVHECQGWVETKQELGRPILEKRLVRIIDEKYITTNALLATWDGKPGYTVFESNHDCAGERPIGIIEGVEQILLGLNDLLNIGIDNARKVVESSLLIDPSSTKQAELLLGPGEHNWVRNPLQSVAPMPMKDLPKSFYELIGMFHDWFQRNTGVIDYAGVSDQTGSPVNKTARGLEMITNQATKRFSPLVRKSDLELYRPIARDIHETAKLFMDQGEPIRLPLNPDSPFAKVGPNDLDVLLNYSFNAKALDMTSGQRRGEFVEMFGMINELAQAGALQGQGMMIDVYEATRILMSEYDREQDVDRIIKRINGGGMPMAPQGGPFATPGQASMPGRPMPSAPPKPGGLGPLTNTA